MSYFIRFIINIILSGFALNASGTKPQEKNIKELHIGHHAFIGFSMGATDAIVTTPFYYFKNALQEGKKFAQISKNPVTWYTGSAANCAGLIACALGQNMTCTALKTNNGSITNWSTAAASGAITAFIACPADFILRHVQSTTKTPEQAAQKESTLKTIGRLYTQHGLRCFARGLVMTALRDSVFAPAYMTAIPYCRAAIKKEVDNKSVARVATLGAVGGIGLITTILTHPFDTIAGALQNDPGKITYKNSLHAARVTYQKQGLKGFFSGIIPRAAMTSISLLALDGSKTWMEGKISAAIQ